MKTLARRRFLSAAFVLLAVALAQPASGQFTFTDVNPDNSNLDPTDADGATGGRVNGLASVAGDNQVYYAASEWGGVYKTIDGGHTWFRLDTHNPNATWDVEVDPGNSSKVIATSFYDGRVSSLAGINMSFDAGTTWNLVSVPNTNGICSASRFNEPSAFGIAFDPDDTNDIYVGTNCGLAISTNGGSSWTRVEVDETPNNNGIDVWDVVVHDGGIIDVCGNAGHHRSEDGGASWDASLGLPGGVCSIAVSPDEADVLFVTVGTSIYESDNGGDTWTNLGTPDFARQGRIPYVATNQRSDDGDDDRFDLYFGDIGTYRGECVSSPAGGANRCPQAYLANDPPDTPPTGWFGSYTRSGAGSGGGHDDVGDIVFDTEAANDACPTIFSSDGGVYYNTLSVSPGCHDPAFEQPTVTPHGLWLWTLTGVDTAGQDMEDLYFGNQDNGPFGATDGGSASPTWNNATCCDGFDTAADSAQVLFSVCCGDPRSTGLLKGSPGMAGSSEVNTYPPGGLIPGFRFPDVIDQWGAAGQYVILTRNCTPGSGACTGADGGVYITTDITAAPIVWTELGPTTEPPTGNPGVCAVKAAMDGGTPTFYVQVGTCDGLSSDQLWRFVGTNPADAWAQVNLPAGGVNIFDVDPGEPDRLFAANNSNPPQMIISDDGGATWDTLAGLDTLMQGGGAYLYVNSRGPRGPVDFRGYPQPSLVAFDAEDPNILAAGGRDSGVFLSTDGGEDWVLVTDPDSTGGSVPHLPQPWFAYFDHESPSGTDVNMYIGTRGRGVWRVTFQQPPIADADGPYVTDEGTDVPLDGSGSFDPNGSPLTYEWDFDDDGLFDDATGVTPDFDPIGDGVGQDGVYPVRLRVTNDDGLSDIDETTVMVNNVAPSVSFDPQDPEDEGSPLIVTGTISDPGWLDPLTATIDWGDGTGIETISGTLENVRPDATLSFEVSHCYGDNGLYTVEVCGSDDDTTTCESMLVQIDNVPPTVDIDPGQPTTIDEGDVIAVLAHFSDPGWLDTYTSMIDWGYGGWMDPGLITMTNQGSDCGDPDMGDVTGSRQYGDNGLFTITVSVTDDDLGIGSDFFDLTVNNIDPTAEIDESGAVDVCGDLTFIAHAGEDVDFSGRSTDPGSDDLFLSWDWDDGPPSPDVTTDYLVNNPVPGPDPLPSPEVDPRDITDLKTHAFADACYYDVSFLADDDDGGHGEDDTDVVITGNSNQVRSAGYWRHNYRRRGHRFFTNDQLQCYLDIVDHMSSVFSEITAASTLDDAEEVLDPSHSNGDIRVQFDRQLLAVWLNFANGAIEHDQLVDTDFDDVPDTALLDVLCAAEAARANPATTRDELENWKDILEGINLMDASGSSASSS